MLVPAGDQLLENKTLPEYLSIRQSNIKGAQYGVFTQKPLAKGLYFGPYRASTVDDGKYMNESKKVRLHKSGEAPLGDGPLPEGSDWMRYLNCAPNQRDQNLVACIRDGQLCYRTRRAIGAGQELLVEDGTVFAKMVLTVGKPLNSGQPAQDADSGVTGQRLIFTCDTCGSLFSSQDLLDTHRRAMHRPPEQAGQHRCAQCPYSSCHESDLTMHAMTHAGEQFFVCGMCSKRFPSKFSLRLHMKSHESHQCPDCGRRFVRLCGLSRHRRSHCGKASRAAAPQ
ncbi:PR domain zinc finger protein 14-like [Amblyomma americanum]